MLVEVLRGRRPLPVRRYLEGSHAQSERVSVSYFFLLSTFSFISLLGGGHFRRQGGGSKVQAERVVRDSVAHHSEGENSAADAKNGRRIGRSGRRSTDAAGRRWHGSAHQWRDSHQSP